MSEYIIDELIHRNYIQEKNRESYQYGMLVLIMNIIPIIIILGISIAFNKLAYGLFFLISFIPIRINLGGYHCKEIKNCIITFVVIYLYIIHMNFFTNYEFIKFFGVVCILLILCFNPISYNENSIINNNWEKSKSRLRKSSFFLLIIVTFFSNIFNSAVYMGCILNVALYFIGLVDLKWREMI